MAELEKLALGRNHLSRGVVVGREGGCALPLHYGDPGREAEACATGCALVDLSWADRLELRGADRQRLLNGLFSAEVQGLDPGQGVYGFFTDQKGRVMADAYVVALDDRLWLELPAGRGAPIQEHIERYRVIDDVEVVALEDMMDVAVVGERAEETLASMCELPDTDRVVRTRLAGTEVQVCRRRIHGVDGFVLWLPSAVAPSIVDELLDGDPITFCGVSALDSARCAAGVGRWGIDFDADSIANETGLLEEAVDFAKGCYLGQEIVARIFYRGRPSRECRALEIVDVAPDDAGEPPEPAPVTRAGEPCGAVTSVGARDGGGAWAAVGTLSRSCLEAESGDTGWTLGDGRGVVRLRSRRS